MPIRLIIVLKQSLAYFIPDILALFIFIESEISEFEFRSAQLDMGDEQTTLLLPSRLAFYSAMFVYLAR